ncbi:hypothetical protein P7K49_008947, partial [Saguinus oedipus]
MHRKFGHVGTGAAEEEAGQGAGQVGKGVVRRDLIEKLMLEPSWKVVRKGVPRGGDSRVRCPKMCTQARVPGVDQK